MANIPVVQIPNAPQTGSNAVPLPVGAVRTPDIEYMGVVEDASHMAIGRAYENLGAAGQQAASVMNDFAFSMAKASDEANLVRADSVKTDLMSKYYAEVATKPENEWSNIWDSKYADRLSTEVGDMQMMTRDGANRRDSWLQSTQSAVKADIFTKSNQKMIERARMSFDNSIERKLQNGDYEGAFADIARRGTSGLSSPEEDERDMRKVEEDQRVETWTGYIQQNPAEARRVFREAQLSGKPPKGMRSSQLMQFRRMAEGQHAQLVQDTSNNLLQSIEADPTAVTDEMIDKVFSDPRIDGGVEIANKFKEHRAFRYADTPEGKADKATNYSDLWQAIFSYDAATDISMADPDTHKREYQKLQQRIIESAPEGERKPFLDTLNDMVSQASQGKKSRTDDIARGLMQQADKLAEWGQFGQTGDWKKEKRGDVEVTVPKDVNSWLNVQGKRLEVTNEIRRLMRENPDLTVEQAQERFKGIVEPYLDPAASFMQKPEEEEGWMDALRDVAKWSTWGGLVMNPTANNPNVMTAGFNFRGFESPTDGSKRFAFDITDQTRDQIGKQSTPQERQVSLDFNSGGTQSRGVEIVIPSNATTEERAAAQEYTTTLTAWFKSKGVDVPNRGVMAKTGSGNLVSRFHTEPFFIQDAEARRAIESDPDGYARVLVSTLGRLPVTFIAPHTSTDGGATDGSINERDFARTVIIPALRRVQGGDVMLASQ